jgi:hypothetical protein
LVGPITGKDLKREKNGLKFGRLLGVFEYIYILYLDGIIDMDSIDELYSYRLFHALNNDTIRERHFESRNGTWNGIVSLLIQLRHKKIFSTLVSQQGSPGMLVFFTHLTLFFSKMS